MPLSHGSGWSVFFPAWVRSCSSPGHDLGHSPSRFHGASSLHLDQRARWATGRVSSNETANTADAFTPHHLMGASPGTHLPAESPLLKELEYIAGWACSLGNALILDEGDTKKDDEADHFEKVPRIGLLQIAVILLAVITALIHLDLGVRFLMIGEGGPLPIMWILNFVGYIVLVTRLYLPPLQAIQRMTPWFLMADPVLTVILGTL